MEYVAPHRGNKEHTKAHHSLLEMGYTAYLIDKDGYLQSIANINAYLEGDDDLIKMLEKKAEVLPKKKHGNIPL